MTKPPGWKLRVQMIALILMSLPAFGGSNQFLTYQGRIVRPDGSTINSGSVQFTLSVYSPSPAHCLLYSEIQSVNMLGSLGMFSLNLGSGTRVDSGAHAFSKIFVNGGTLTGLTCSVGNSYSPAATDDRELAVSFNDAGTVINLSSMNIKSVPFALQAHEIDGWGVNNLVKVSTLGSPTTFTTSEMANAKLLATPGPCSANDILKWNGSAWLCSADATGGSPSDASYLAKGVFQADTDAAISGLAFSSAGVLKVNAGTGANQILKLDASSKIPAVDGSQITSLSASQLSAGTLSIARGGTGASTKAGAFDALSPNSAKGDITIHNGTTNISLPVGTNGQVLTADSAQASGVKWANVTAGTVTSITAGTGLNGGTITSTGTLSLNVGTGANQIVQLDASSKLPAVDGSALTGLTASQVSSGTIPVTRGGTGTGSFAGNGVIVSNLTGSQLSALNCGSGQVITFDGSGYAICGAAAGTTGFVNGGNSFGGNATLGTNDAYTLSLKANGSTALMIDTSANVGIGTSSPSARLTLMDNNLSASSRSSQYIYTGVQPATNQSASVKNVSLEIYNQGVGTRDIGKMIGVFSTASQDSGGGVASEIIGGLFSADKNTGGATVNMSGLKSMTGMWSGGTTTNLAGLSIYNEVSLGTAMSQYGIHIQDVAQSGGSVTNRYGIYLRSFTGTATNDYGIFQAGASQKNYFAGNVGIGVSNPQSPLDIKGALRLTGATSGYAGFQPAANAGSTIWTLPAADGSAGQFLQTNGSGILTWGSASTAALTSLNGSTVAAQTFVAPGSSGTAPNWSTNTGTGAHTLNIPMASTASVTAGLIAKTDYDSFSAKLGTTTSFAGDISGFYNSTTVDKIKGTAVSISTLTSGNFLKYNGSAWINTNLASSDVTTGLGYTPVNQAGDTMSGTLNMNGNSVTNVTQVSLKDSTTNAITLRAPTSVTSYNFTLPSTAGSSGQVLTTDGSGNLSWLSAGGTTGFVNGGNSFGGNATLGTNDNFSLGLKTNNSTRLMIDNAGLVGIGTTSPASKLTVSDSTTQTNSLDYFTGYFSVNLVPTSASSAPVSAVYGLAKYNGTVDSVGARVFGLNGRAENQTTKVAGILVGNTSLAINSSTGTANFAEGIEGTVENLSTGTIGTAKGVLATVLNDSTGVITNGYGVYTGVIQATNKWSIYASDSTAPSYFAGSVGINTSTPGAALDVKGEVRMTGATSGYAGLKSPAVGPSVTWTLPTADGSAGQFLKTDGSGNLSWASASTSAITSLNGSSIAAQSFAVPGTSGTAPAWSSNTGTGVHTLNIPLASTASVTAGLISKSDYDTFNTKLGTTTSFAGDVSGVYNSTTVDKIKGTAITINTLASGNFLKYNGSAWVNSNLASGDVTTGLGYTPVNRAGDTMSGALNMNGSNVTNVGQMSLKDSATNTITLRAPSSVTSYNFTLPSTAGSSGQVLATDGSGNLSWVAAGGTTGFSNGGNSFGGNATLGTNDSYSLALKTSNTARMTINSNGKMGIGSTNSTGALLDIYDNADVAYNVTITNGSVGGSAAGGLALYNNSTRVGTIAALSTNNTMASGTYQNKLRISSESTGSGTVIGSDSATGTIAFVTGGTATSNERITIKADGKVGIGTNSPSYPFHFQNTTSGTAAYTAAYELIYAANVNNSNQVIGHNSIAYHSYGGNYSEINATQNEMRHYTTSGTLGTGRGAYNYFSSWGGGSMPDSVTNGIGAENIAGNGTIAIAGPTTGSVSVGNLKGSYNRALENSAGTTVTNAYGTHSEVVNTAGTVTNAYGLYSSISGAGTTTNAYGVYVPALSGTNRFGVYQAGTADTNYLAGSVGIGSNSPRSKLDVNGTISGAPAVSNATTTIDFGKGNIHYTANDCQAYSLNNMKDGASYTFVVKGTVSATCSFTAFSDAGVSSLSVHLPPGHTATTGGNHTIYNFVVVGSDVYVAWIPGY